jgi:hypothetical protein
VELPMVFIHKLMCHDSSEMLEGKESEMLEGGGSTSEWLRGAPEIPGEGG